MNDNDSSWNFLDSGARILGPNYDNLGPNERARRATGAARRRAGAIMGAAVGDALGAPYEFKPSQGITLAGTSADMTGGGTFNWEPGEWTDDTSMMIPMLLAFRDIDRYDVDASETAIVQGWRQWALTATDVGNQTRAVLGRLDNTSIAADARAAAASVHQRQGRSAGNGSLMRTAPAGLMVSASPSGFFSPARTVDTVVTTARALSDLTHYDEDAGDACVLWSVMIHMATMLGQVDPADALLCLPPSRRDRWAGMLDKAAKSRPGDFPNNGWVVHALQAAWSAIHVAGLDVADHSTATPERFRLALQHAINAGGDTDTVAAITGALAGALVGIDAIPLGWQRVLHGWGGDGVVMSGSDLVTLAADAHANTGGDRWEFYPQLTTRVDYSRFGEIATLARHPHDDGVLMGAVGVLDDLPTEVHAVVSLCRIGNDQVPERVAATDQVQVWLIDREAPEENPNLEFVFVQAADAVAELRAQGKTVFLHCVQAQSRTPSVAAVYSVRHCGVESMDVALAEVCAALPSARPNRVFRRELALIGDAE